MKCRIYVLLIWFVLISPGQRIDFQIHLPGMPLLCMEPDIYLFIYVDILCFCGETEGRLTARIAWRPWVTGAAPKR